MTAFAVYEADTGRIVSTGSAVSGATAAMQAGPGQCVIVEDGVRDTDHYVVLGEIPVIADRPHVEIPTSILLPAGAAAIPVTPALPAGSFAMVTGGPAAMSPAMEVMHTPAEPGVFIYRISLPFPYRAAEPLTVIVEA